MGMARFSKRCTQIEGLPQPARDVDCEWSAQTAISEPYVAYRVHRKII